MTSFLVDTIDEDLDLNSACKNSSKILVEDQNLNNFLVENHCTTKKDIIETLEKTKVSSNNNLANVETFNDFASLFEDYTDFFNCKINFSNWKSLKTIKLPELMLNIPSFFNCESLESLTLPKYTCINAHCIFIPINTFSGCTNLKSLTFERQYGEICFSSETKYSQIKKIHISENIVFNNDNFAEILPNVVVFRDVK